MSAWHLMWLSRCGLSGIVISSRSNSSFDLTVDWSSPTSHGMRLKQPTRTTTISAAFFSVMAARQPLLTLDVIFTIVTLRYRVLG